VEGADAVVHAVERTFGEREVVGGDRCVPRQQA
jgi:hypothetical protein